ncbi:MAG: PD-(D/E)XK nuclease family protein [Candidatus Promineifilaceae bacterium]|jgi:CRISPR-associated exonuclease Cas4
MAWGSLTLSLLLIAFAAGVLLLSRRWQKQSGLPEGGVIYSDDGTWFKNSDVLTDPELRLAGRPDYLVEQENGCIVPVEIKSGRAPRMPYPGHVMQLMAYCRLVDAVYGIRPTHGILQYSDRAFSVDFTATLEQDLLDTLEEMRRDQVAYDLEPNHSDPRRCSSCGFREQCEDNLAFE